LSGSKLNSLIGNSVPKYTPNIYLLVYDSYVSNETMLAYGINNNDQEDYLIGQGFKLYPHTYSISSSTISSIGSVLDVSTHGNNRQAVAGDSVVHRIVKRLGYDTYGVFTSDYFFQGYDSSYDYTSPEFITQSYKYLISAVLIGEFRFDIEINNQTHDQYVEEKRNILSDISDEQVFIYAHSNLPSHSQNSGVCLPDETELFHNKLTKANLEIREDIEMIINHDPGAIIIIAGDHGPYLTKNCYNTAGEYETSEITRLDIQDRYGTFLAIRWPTEGYEKYDDIEVLQDIFPAIFAYLYSDARILESKIVPITINNITISGASVNNGIIVGGIDDGEPLFLSGD
jgi:hypothetical protein